MIHKEYLQAELRRLAGVLLAGLVIGFISGQWLLSLLLVSMLLNGWMLYKLSGLCRWLDSNQDDDLMPDSDGLWEQVTSIIHRNRKRYLRYRREREALSQRFDNIMTALPDAQILLDDEHAIVWVNPATERLLGIRLDSDHGQRIDNLIRIRKLTKLLHKPSDEEILFQSPLDAHIACSARLFFVQDGLNLLSVRDISQRVNLNAMRRAFIANASHELRTPLTVISGYLEMFEEDPDLPAHLLPAIQQTRGQSERMHHIIADMLTLAKLENQEREQLVGVPVNIARLIDENVSNLQNTLAQAGSHQLIIAANAAKGIRGIALDIASVVNNLLVNAIKHTPAGSTIRVSWQQNAAGQGCFTVADDGPGIDPQHIDHLTERFYRVDKGRSRDTGGTGLGLAIVKHIILNHEGELTISSEPGNTVFTACFPAERLVALAE